MGAEMRVVVSGVAADDVALHPRGVELVHPLDHRLDAADEPLLDFLDQIDVLDNGVAAPLVGMVRHRDGAAVDLAAINPDFSPPLAS